MSLTLVTPAEAFVTVDDVKANSRIDGNDDDALIEGMISAAVSYAERWTSRQFAPATWDYGISAFPGKGEAIDLPLLPVTSVASISYEDSDGNPQTVATYTYAGGAVSGDWPPGSEIVVRFTAGDGVPAAVRQAIFLIVGHWYERRETAAENALSEIPMGAHALLNLHRNMFV